MPDFRRVTKEQAEHFREAYPRPLLWADKQPAKPPHLPCYDFSTTDDPIEAMVMMLSAKVIGGSNTYCTDHGIQHMVSMHLLTAEEREQLEAKIAA